MCCILYSPWGMLTGPGSFDIFREDSTFRISPFVTGLKTNLLSFGLMLSLLQAILANVALHAFGRVAPRVAATFIKNALKPFAISLLSLVIVDFIFKDFGLCSHGFLLGRKFLIAFHKL